MTAWVAVIAAIIIVEACAFAWLAWEARKAAHGWQDDTGFHHGREPFARPDVERINREDAA